MTDRKVAVLFFWVVAFFLIASSTKAIKARLDSSLDRKAG